MKEMSMRCFRWIKLFNFFFLFVPLQIHNLSGMDDYITLLEHAIEKSDQEWLAQFKMITHETVNNLHFWHSSIKDPLFNTIKGTLTASSVDIFDGITEIITRCKKTEKSITWFTRKGKDLEIDKRFDQLPIVKTSLVAMIYFLPQQHISVRIPSTFTIKRIDKSDVQEWINTFNDGFGENDHRFSEQYADVITRDIEEKAHEHYCIKNAEKEIVSVGSLYIHDKVAEISNIATKKDMRKKGLASAMIQALLNRASSLDVQYTYLIATSEARSVYENCGFVKVFDLNAYEYSSDLSE